MLIKCLNQSLDTTITELITRCIMFFFSLFSLFSLCFWGQWCYNDEGAANYRWSSLCYNFDFIIAHIIIVGHNQAFTQCVCVCAQSKLLQEGRAGHAASEVDATWSLHGGNLHIQNWHMVRTHTFLSKTRASLLSSQSFCSHPDDTCTLWLDRL